jgi:divalent metal cation (Fe/Co/Zn/Cd) transporter
MLDGTEPAIVHEIEHAAGHVAGIRRIEDVRARWLGHRLAVELDIGVDGTASVSAADGITSALERELAAHLPALGRTRVRVRPYQQGKDTMTQSNQKKHDHDHPHPHDDKGGHAHDHPHPHPHDDKHGHDHKDGHKHDHPHDHRH